MRKTAFLLAAVCLCMVAASPRAGAQVLGPCGAPAGAEETKAAPAAAAAPAMTAVSHVPLPGERAMDFELAAVVGDEIKMIKLSDYQGKWRVVCFFPAAFTFV